MPPPLVYAVVRPTDDQESSTIPHARFSSLLYQKSTLQVLTREGAKLTLNELDGAPRSIALDAVWDGSSEMDPMLHEILTQLCDSVDKFGNAALNVIGGTSTGKSYCLLGSREDNRVGIVSHFADTYYQQESSNKGLIELAIYQVYEEKVRHAPIQLHRCSRNKIGLRSSFSPTEQSPWFTFLSSSWALVSRTNPPSGAQPERIFITVTTRLVYQSLLFSSRRSICTFCAPLHSHSVFVLA